MMDVLDLINKNLEEIKESNKEIFIRLNKIESFISFIKGGFLTITAIGALIYFVLRIAEVMQWIH